MITTPRAPSHNLLLVDCSSGIYACGCILRLASELCTGNDLNLWQWWAWEPESTRRQRRLAASQRACHVVANRLTNRNTPVNRLIEFGHPKTQQIDRIWPPKELIGMTTMSSVFTMLGNNDYEVFEFCSIWALCVLACYDGIVF